MPASLAPRLTRFDESVLSVLSVVRGMRAERVASLAVGTPSWRCDECRREVPADQHGATWRAWRRGETIGCAACRARAGRRDDSRTLWPVRVTTPEQRREVREVLRGLERVGAVSQAGGWWRRA
jgi:hypothetical protein